MESDEPISEVIARVRGREVFTFDDLDSGQILRDAERLANEVERISQTRFWVIGDGYDMYVIRAPTSDAALACLRAAYPGRFDEVTLTPGEIPVAGPTEIVEEYIL